MALSHLTSLLPAKQQTSGLDPKGHSYSHLGFLGGSVCKQSACNAGDTGSILGSGRSPGGGHGNPLQYSGLENPRHRGAWWATVHGVAKSWTQLITQAKVLHFLHPVCIND